MGIRWIIHKKDGKTVASDWNSNEESFRMHWSNNITSIQLQRENKKLYTLSARNNSKTLFWQTDNFLLNANTELVEMIARKIFKSLGKDIWLELILDINTGRPFINIINKKIKVD